MHLVGFLLTMIVCISDKRASRWRGEWYKEKIHTVCLLVILRRSPVHSRLSLGSVKQASVTIQVFCDFTRCRLFSSYRLSVAAHCLHLQRQTVYEESFLFFVSLLLNTVTLTKCNWLFRNTVTNCIWSEVKHAKMKAITFCATGVDTNCSFLFENHPSFKVLRNRHVDTLSTRYWCMFMISR